MEWLTDAQIWAALLTLTGPTVKILSLSFLLLIGFTLIAEGLDRHIPKGYIYFAMAFSVFVEMINLKVRPRRTAPVKLHEPYIGEISRAS